MKSIASCFIFLFSFTSLSQSSLEFNYSEVYIGRNLNLSWEKTMSDFSISAGLTYHINRVDKIPIGTLIKKSAFAENFGQRFGVQVGFDYSLFKNEHVALGVFYTNQTSFISQVIKLYPAYEPLVPNPQSEFDFSYLKLEMSIGPFFTSDNIIGVTMKNKVTEDIYFTFKAGLGFLLWKNTDDSFILLVGNKPNQSYNFTSFLSAGLGYSFRGKNKKTH